MEQGYTIAKMIRGAMGPTPITSLHYTTAAMAQALARVLRECEYDIVQMESPLLASYLPVIRAAEYRPLVICDWHNIESEVMRRYSQHSRNIVRRGYAWLTTRHTSDLERRIVGAVDAHLVVSERDRDWLLGLKSDGRVFVIENGVDTTFYDDEAIKQAYQSWSAADPPPHRASGTRTETPRVGMQRRRLLFVGSMDYHANVDAVVEFARDVWPAIHKQRPELVFTVVGRRPTREVRALGRLPAIEVTGTVADIRPYYHDAIAVVVPLRIGGGTRLKILEAMAAGVPVISSRLGAEGLAVSDREDILLAERADEYYQALAALEDERRRRSLIDRARALVRTHYDWSAIGARLIETHLLLAGSTPPQRSSRR
jgi:glycosyltransferase involved in cell wall biosynthesis